MPPPWSHGDDTIELTNCVDEPGSEGVTAQAEAGGAGSGHDGRLTINSLITTGTDTVTLTGAEFQLLMHAMKKADQTVPLFKFEGYLERVPATFMVDSGANENYLGPELARLAQIRPVPIEAPY